MINLYFLDVLLEELFVCCHLLFHQRQCFGLPLLRLLIVFL